jgi:cell wall-associated NlpC family hydrolase
VNQLDDLIREAKSWVRTPYHPQASVKGVGVDCVNFVCQVYQSADLVGEFQMPNYSMDGGMHMDSEIVEPYIIQAGFHVVETGNMPGDLLAFKIGKIVYHLGIQISSNLFVHAIRTYGVIESRLDDSTYLKRLHKIYRII